MWNRCTAVPNSTSKLSIGRTGRCSSSPGAAAKKSSRSTRPRALAVEQEAAAARARDGRLRHPGREHRRHQRVARVAAARQHVRAGLGRERMPGGDGAAGRRRSMRLVIRAQATESTRASAGSRAARSRPTSSSWNRGVGSIANVVGRRLGRPVLDVRLAGRCVSRSKPVAITVTQTWSPSRSSTVAPKMMLRVVMRRPRARSPRSPSPRAGRASRRRRRTAGCRSRPGCRARRAAT